VNNNVIYHEALLLPFQERAKLAEQLLSSLDELPEKEIETLWFQEANLRAIGLDKKNVERISSEVVQLEVQKLFK
jgi:hypothetical protein